MSEKNSSTSDTSTINNGNIEGNNKEKKGVSEIDKARNALKGIIVNFILILLFYINQLIFFKGGPLA